MCISATSDVGWYLAGSEEATSRLTLSRHVTNVERMNFEVDGDEGPGAVTANSNDPRVVGVVEYLVDE